MLSVQLEDGTLASYVMWVHVDGEQLIMATEANSTKHRALMVNPNISMVILTDDPYDYIEIRGNATAFERGDAARELIEDLGRKYNGQPYGRPVEWVLIRIQPFSQRRW